MSFFQGILGRLHRIQSVRLITSSVVCSTALYGLGYRRNSENAASERDSFPVVFTWGSNQFGQLGVGSDKDEALPRALSFFKDQNLKVVSVVASGNMSAVLTSSGSCLTFGFDAEANQAIPTPLLDANGVLLSLSQIDVGGQHGAAVTQEGGIVSWGNGWNGQLGNGEESSSEYAVEAATGVTQFLQVSCGHSHTAAVDTQGNLWTWGSGRDAALGHGTRESHSKPEKVKGLCNVVSVSCGQESTICLTKEGKVFTFGSNDYGQLGHGNSVNRYEMSPKLVSALSNEKVVQVAAGDYHAACVTVEGKVYTWGMGKDGQTGHNDKMDISRPKLVSRLKGEKVIRIACGGGHTCAISEDQQLWCWGRGRSGQIGRADNLESVAAYRATPQHVDTFGSCKVVRVDCGGDHTIALVMQ
mmetsp:Transcript_7939/g.10370  ORF Transcript_7939/g.10370 Transcript_7939/m.10370 type:complete len:414 (-) Transcript_7939:2197-3438(-)